MNLKLLPEEREALLSGMRAVERIYGYAKVMIDHGAPLDDIEELADIHAISAGLSLELLELVARIDGNKFSSALVEPELRILIHANCIAKQLVERRKEANLAQKTADAIDRLYEALVAF